MEAASELSYNLAVEVIDEAAYRSEQPPLPPGDRALLDQLRRHDRGGLAAWALRRKGCQTRSETPNRDWPLSGENLPDFLADARARHVAAVDEFERAGTAAIDTKGRD
jgi:hypothetical protein